MALVFQMADVLASLPHKVKPDLYVYLKNQVLAQQAAATFQSGCGRQQACFYIEREPHTDICRFQLALSHTIENTTSKLFAGPYTRHLASLDGTVLPFYAEDDVVPLQTRALPMGQVLAVTRADILTEATLYNAPSPTMAAVAIFRALQTISHAHDYKYTCPTEALKALLALPVRDPVAPAQRVSCLVR